MDNSQISPGKTTIAPEVLTSIARLTTLGTEGVTRMSTVPGDVNQFFKRGLLVNEGVRISVEDGTVYADVYVIIMCDMNAREVSHTVQTNVARAISEMVGMEVGRVNVHIEDIDYTSKAEA